MLNPFTRILDALDIETYLLCTDEAEGRQIAASLMEKMSLTDYDIVYIKHQGPGARIRLRAYFNRPGDSYSWLEELAHG